MMMINWSHSRTDPLSVSIRDNQNIDVYADQESKSFGTLNEREDLIELGPIALNFNCVVSELTARGFIITCLKEEVVNDWI